MRRTPTSQVTSDSASHSVPQSGHPVKDGRSQLGPGCPSTSALLWGISPALFPLWGLQNNLLMWRRFWPALIGSGSVLIYSCTTTLVKTSSFPGPCCSWVTFSDLLLQCALKLSLCPSGLHAERPREGDRPAPDHGEGSGEEAAPRRVHRCRHAEPQNQRTDQGHEQPAAGTDTGSVHGSSRSGSAALPVLVPRHVQVTILQQKFAAHCLLFEGWNFTFYNRNFWS